MGNYSAEMFIRYNNKIENYPLVCIFTIIILYIEKLLEEFASFIGVKIK